MEARAGTSGICRHRDHRCGDCGMTTLLPPNVKVHLALGFIDMRKGIDGLKAGTVSPASSPIPPRTTSSNTDSQVEIGILQRLGFVKPRVSRKFRWSPKSAT